MAQRGRKPKPTAVKVLEGNPGKRSLNTAEPKPEKKAPRSIVRKKYTINRVWE